MSPHLDEQLVREFPLLYVDRNGDMRLTCMCWGFACGDGWFDLLYRLSAKLEPMIAALPPTIGDHTRPRATQVKEKFGTLRFYMLTSTEEMDAAITLAEEESARTCEYCGEPGVIRLGGWIRTLCDACNGAKK